MTRSLARVRFASLGVCLTLLTMGCGKAGPAAPTTPAAAGPALAVIKPERKTLRHVIEQPAYIEAIEETPLIARIAGYVQKVHVDIGDAVKKDDILAEIAVPEMEVELRQKDALVRQAEAELKLSKDSVAAANAEYHRARSQHERLAKIGKGVLDKENIEETQFAFETSKARHEIAQADVAVKDARLDVARANRDYTRSMLEYCKVRAPYDGIITRRNIHTGCFLQPGTGNGAAPLFVVARTDVVRVLVHVPEAEAGFISLGMSALVRVQTHEIEGKVTRSSWSYDPRSRTLRTEVDLDNARQRLRPGMYASVALTAELPDRFTLPAAALLNHNGQTCCYQLFEGKAVCVPLKVGLREGQLVELFKKQVRVGKSDEPTWQNITGQEFVLLGNLADLQDGQKVEVRP